MEEKNLQPTEIDDVNAALSGDLRLNSLDNKILQLEKGLQEKRAMGIAFAIIGAACFALLIAYYVNLVEIKIWWLVVLWVFGPSMAINVAIAFSKTDKKEIESLKERRQRILSAPQEKGEKGRAQQSSMYFGQLVNINVENLSAYYALVKRHTSYSFMVSLSVALLGFCLLVAGLWMGMSQSGEEQDKLISYLTAGSGLVVEFISGALFYLYNKTVIQLKEYHDSLIEVQNILLSFKLIDDTQDQETKKVMMEKMLEFLVKSKGKSE